MDEGEGLLRQTDGKGAGESRVEDSTELQFVMAGCRKQAEAKRARSGDNASEMAVWLMDCRSWKLKEAGQEKRRGGG